MIRVMLRFSKDAAGVLCAFVTHCADGIYRGVSSFRECKKKICLLAQDVKTKINPDLIYDALLIPMRSKRGFVVVHVKPHLYKVSFLTVMLHDMHFIEMRYGRSVQTYRYGDDAKAFIDSIRCSECIKDKPSVIARFLKNIKKLNASLLIN